MLQSLTSFGSAKLETPSALLNIEIRTLNSSKGLDLNIKLPQSIKDKESSIRHLAQNRLERGKVDIWITEEKNAASAVKINYDLVNFYINEMRNIAAREKFEVNFSNSLKDIFYLPEVISKDDGSLDINEDKFFEAINTAIDSAIDFRRKEGKALQDDIEMRISNIESLSHKLEDFESLRVSRVRQRIKSALEAVSHSLINEERLEQEMIFYIEKFDITEEKVRLSNHCKYFRELLIEEQSQGRKLAFLAQELGREINTIGSKANDFGIQKLVVQMKDELEKIKEQLSNIL